MKIHRRLFLGASVAASNQAFPAGQRFEPWQPGLLDIHHISTGRGNSTLAICPDGTSFMVDAGASTRPLKFTTSPKPDGSRRPGEWIARYALRHLQATGHQSLDYFLLTHLHGDHMGELNASTPQSKRGNYRLTGVTDVAELLPIRHFLDRAWPDYDYPQPVKDLPAANYILFLREQAKRGIAIERFRAGDASQIVLRHNPLEYRNFTVRNIAANGEVWTGVGTETKRYFPEIHSLQPENYPSENMCSAAIRMSYGKFDYYTGGDLTCGTNEGADLWRDIETPVAWASGPVDVAVLNHHGYVDAVGANFVRALRPRAFIIPVWDSAHPGIAVLHRLLSRRLYSGDRDIYATNMVPENKIVNAGLSQLKSDEGHIVIRVVPGGSSFQVVILENIDESDRVKAVFGPYVCL